MKSFFLGLLGNELYVFACSMLPVIELRGAIPLGAGFGLPWWQTYLIAVIGNMLPVPFILANAKAYLSLSLLTCTGSMMTPPSQGTG